MLESIKKEGIMSEPIINFDQFKGMVNTKLNKINMSQGRQSYVQSQLASIFKQGDVNKDKQLSKSELNSVLGMLNQVVSLAQATDLDNPPKTETPKIKDPRFQGLEDYQFEQHGAKEGIGAITVNGEKMLIEADGKGGYQLQRFDGKNGEWYRTEYSSKDELNKALTDKNNDFGSYSGFEDLSDIIP